MIKLFEDAMPITRPGLALAVLMQSIVFSSPVSLAQTVKPVPVAKLSIAQPSYQSLSSLLHRDPKNATAYYLRGCLLMKAGNGAAIKDFERASQLAPGTRIEEFSKLAITRLVPASPKISAEQSTDDSSADQKPIEEAPNQTVATIRKQAEMAHARALERGQIEAQEEVNKADNQAKAAQERVQRQAMEAALGRYGGEQRFDPYAFVSPAQVEAFRAQAAATAERVRNLGQLKAGLKEQEGHEKANEIDYQAENLERQLKDDHPLSGIKLNPVGTNLYTRNYALVPPTVKAVKARALPLPGVTVRTGTSLQYDLQKTALNASRAPLSSQAVDARGNVVKSSVKGQVLPSRQPH